MSDFSPQRLFGAAAEGSWHEEFLERARLERERGDDAASRGALAGYLIARLIERSLDTAESDEERQAYGWQLDSARRYVGELDGQSAEVRHLDGIVEALRCSDGGSTPAVRLALNAFAYFLENEGRLAESLDVLGLGARTYGAAIPATEFSAVALSAGRLNRLQARFDAATSAYAAAEESASVVGDLNRQLLSRLGRANVFRGQGNLPLARQTVEQIIGEASGAPDLVDVLSRAYADLAAVLVLQGHRLEALKAAYESFRLTHDPVTRMRVLGDLGVQLAELGYWDMARVAFEIVVVSDSFIVKTNARIELMDLESAAGNRVAFERHRAELREAGSRMPPSMTVDYRYKTGLGLARFGQTARAREAWADGMRLAEAHRLNEWYFRLERLCANLDQSESAALPKLEPATPPAAIADMAAGLQAYAEAASV